VEIVELDVEMGDDLIAKTRDLAVRYFGDDSDASLAQVLEVAFRIRCLWSHSVKQGQLEIEEVVSNWKLAKGPVMEENNDIIRQWLFRR
jgi:hypothetical protein